jgi:hypothetical protein
MCFKKNQKIQMRNSNKITKHGKKKNDKYEIGNILFKHVFTSLYGIGVYNYPSNQCPSLLML